MSNVSVMPGTQRLKPVRPFSPANWQGMPSPGPVNWLVEGSFVKGTVGMLNGDGGLGKSLLMQQLMTAAATSRPWLGMDVMPCKSFALFCEDDAEEIQRRQERINAHYDCEMGDLDGMMFVSRPGEENLLMEFDRRTDRPLPTPFFEQIRQVILDHGAQLVIFDTVADVFGGNELVRNQVRRFIQAMRQLAVAIQGTVILTAHPSAAGMSSGTGISGSTAWNNSVRSRLYLTKDRQDEDEADSNVRYLKTMKSNHGPFGGRHRLRWNDGVFIKDEYAERRDPGASAGQIDADVYKALRLCIERGDQVSPAKVGHTPFAKFIRPMPGCLDYTSAEIHQSMERLLNKGHIVIVEVKRPNRTDTKKLIRPADMTYHNEAGEEETHAHLL